MKRTRFITDGAALLAVYAVLLLVSMYVPILSAVVTFALPLPFILFMVRYKFSSTCMFFVSALFITIIVSQPISLVKTVMFGLIGIVLGYMYKKEKKPVEILLVGALAYLISFVMIYVGSIKFFNIDLMKQMQDMFNGFIGKGEQMMNAAGQPLTKEKKELLGQFNDLLRILLPSLLAMVAVMYSWFTLLMTGNVLKRLKHNVTPFPQFRNMQFPKSIVWYYVIFILLSTFMEVESTSYLHMVFSNLYAAFSILLVFQGFSFIAFLAYEKGYTKAVLIITFIVCMFIPMLFPLVTILGIIDLGISLRSKIQSK
ncbi:DUF2232 domain-containing protein [Bacillus clarus]|uniref:DUF2232 domain-containing protein n=1 Tax=Bacillus clarus TaxID=2338372 RepID=A0A090ZFS6_9BACI|nr:YybS family protein [Bacillus clarus]KFN03061.1 hypothetical protein DJ93_2456 [Bacillus clarus]RFT65722.1 DUF2232 domain-containing protein [Bacillus clarus]